MAPSQACQARTFTVSVFQEKFSVALLLFANIVFNEFHSLALPVQGVDSPYEYDNDIMNTYKDPDALYEAISIHSHEYIDVIHN